MSDRNRFLNRHNLLLVLLGFQLILLLNWIRIWPQSPNATLTQATNIDQATDVELAFVIPDTEEEAWERLRQSFEETHPDIHIRLFSHPPTLDTTSERAAIYNADFAANVPQYDLVYIDSSWTAQFADHLINLRTLANSDDASFNEFLDGFLASEIQAGEYEGGLYRIPMRADIGLLFYRQDLLSQIGVSLPNTLPELKQVVETLALKSGDSVGYLWQGDDYEGLVTNFVEVLATVGGTWIDPDTHEPKLDHPKTIEAANILRELIQSQISPERVTRYIEQDSLDEFLQGNTIFFRGWPAFYQEIADKFGENNVGISLPFSFGYESGIGCRGGWGFGISKKTAHPQEAWEAIQYFTSAEAQKTFLTFGYLPTRLDLFSDADVITQYPHIPQLLTYLENSSVFRPKVEQYTEVSKYLRETLSQILGDEKSAEEAMAIAQAQTEKLLMSEKSK